MKEKIFKRVDEKIYTEKLDNGIEVYLYKTDKTKNFYLSISVKYGANVLKYKINNKTYDIIPGSAHFLEHKVMALSENKEISKRINDLGSLANAWTGFACTNYNLFGSTNINENIKLLLDIFYHINITRKSVEEEKGIIDEEIDMYQDSINRYLNYQIFNNLFTKSYIKYPVEATHEDIKKINAKSLNKIYNDFYTPNNTFIIICGNFDECEVMNTIKDYMTALKLKQKPIPKRIKSKEKEIVLIPYSEIQKDMEDTKIKFGIKIKKKLFNIKSDFELISYIRAVLTINFSSTSKLFEKYKNENIISYMSYSASIVDDYVAIVISVVSENGNEFINNIKEDLKSIDITEEEFNRKKKSLLKSYILTFDSIEDVEYLLSSSITNDKKIYYDEYDIIENSNYKEAVKVSSCIKNNLDNISIIKTIK